MSRSTASPRFWSMLASTPQLLKLVWQATPLWLVLTIAITLLASLVPVVWLYVNKLIVDWITNAIAQGVVDWSVLTLLVGIRFVLTLGKEGLNELRPYVLQVLSDRFSLYANRRLLEQAIRLDLAHYESPEFYEALSRAQQSGSSYPVRALGTLTNLLGQVTNLIGLLILLFKFSPAIVILLILSSLPTLRVGVNLSNQRFSLNRKQTFNGRLSAYFQRLLTHQDFVKEVRLFNLGDYLLNQWHSIYQENNREIEHLATRQAKARLWVGLLPNLGFYGAYVWVLVRTVQGSITLGDFTMYSGAFSQSQTLLSGMVQNIAIAYESNLYISQYFDFLDLEPQIASPRHPTPFPNPIREGITLHDVCFKYPGAEQPVLQNLNLEIKPGENIAIVGVNGAGKTTLVKLLTRLYDTDSGQITIDGIPIYAFDLTELRRNIAVLFQDFAQYKLGIRENIGFGDIEALDDHIQIEKAAQASGASELIANLEQGYATKLGNLFPEGRELSGGQWQKLGLARAFMSRAQILILDEPTAAMDAIAEFELFERFRQLTQGKITFFVSHRFSTVRLADRIVVIDHNQIVEVGHHEELLEKDGLYAKMFLLQAAGYQLKTPKDKVKKKS